MKASWRSPASRNTKTITADHGYKGGSNSKQLKIHKNRSTTLQYSSQSASAHPTHHHRDITPTTPLKHTILTPNSLNKGNANPKHSHADFHNSPRRGRTAERTPYGSSRSQCPPVSGRGTQLIDRTHEGSPLPKRYQRPIELCRSEKGQIKQHKFSECLSLQPPKIDVITSPIEWTTYRTESATLKNPSLPSKTQDKTATTCFKKSPTPISQNDGCYSNVAKMKDFWDSAMVHNSKIDVRPRREQNIKGNSKEELLLKIQRPPAACNIVNLKNNRTQSNISPKTILEPSRSISPMREADAGGEHEQPVKALNDRAFRNNRDKDGPSDSMSPFLRPHPSSTSLTTVRPLLLKTPPISMMSILPTTTTRTHGKTSDMSISTDIQHIYAKVERQLDVMESTSQIKESRNEKRKMFVQKWNLRMPRPTPETPNLAPGGNAANVISSQEGQTEVDDGAMLVIGVDCGLEEPKPLRLTELQSIMMLCRGRRGIFVLERADPE